MAMKNQNFIKENLSLIIGISLPVLLILVFLAISKTAILIKNPPKYGFLFTVNESYNSGRIPVSLKLIVKNERLYAQYLKLDLTKDTYVQWKKLYYFDPQTKKVKLITLGFPNDINSIEGVKEELLEDTKNFKIDTTLTSPDGYSLGYVGHTRSGLLSEIFVGSRYNSTPSLNNGEDSVPLLSDNQNTYFYYGSVDPIGWVIGSHQ